MFFKKLLLEQNPFLASSLEAALWARIRVRAAAPSGEGGSRRDSRGVRGIAAEPLSRGRRGVLGWRLQSQTLAVTAIWARRGSLWRLTDYRVERTTWKCVPPHPHSHQFLESQPQKESGSFLPSARKEEGVQF